MAIKLSREETAADLQSILDRIKMLMGKMSTEEIDENEFLRSLIALRNRAEEITVSVEAGDMLGCFAEDAKAKEQASEAVARRVAAELARAGKSGEVTQVTEFSCPRMQD